ncbi:MAG TPA: XTP/dITP diphosphatase [Desulfomonilaceae bacterium]|nr:XTP/dITP diphosphatase [Desulfomonilaceae bacterium]
MKHIPEKIIMATANRGKVAEIRDLVKALPVEFLCLADLPDYPHVVEDGATFEENALIKARALTAATSLVSIADDSGLCVDALDGRPGVLSARYGGQNTSDLDKCRLILEELHDVPDASRTARFVCAIALVAPDGEEHVFRGVCEGRITRELRGTGGFGYDPVFFYDEAGCTFAEMDRESKNRVSHRGQALKRLFEFLNAL